MKAMTHHTQLSGEKETRRKEAILAPYPLHYVKGVVGYVWMKRLVSVYFL